LTRTLGNALARQLLEAIDEAVKTAKEFEDFHATVKAQRPEDLSQWELNYKKWFEEEGWSRDNIECPFRAFDDSTYAIHYLTLVSLI
jgi:hypothetical protein